MFAFIFTPFLSEKLLGDFFYVHFAGCEEKDRKNKYRRTESKTEERRQIKGQ